MEQGLRRSPRIVRLDALSRPFPGRPPAQTDLRAASSSVQVAIRLRTPDLACTIPAPLKAGNISGRILKRPTRADCKSADYVYGGSNPSPPIP